MNKKVLAAVIVLVSVGFSRCLAVEENILVIHADEGEEVINKDIYGHFAEHLGRCIYEGFWVGEDSEIPNVRGIRTDVVEALKKLDIPVLRWPGGCFADEYHWKEGIGPREERPKMVNTHWGMVTETNAFGTHEFLDLCEMLGCDAYVAGNVGSGTPEEMQDWVEYMTFDGDSEMANLRRGNGRDRPWKIKYFGVGNENWGCGGNMTPEYYSDLYKRFATFVKNYPGSRIKRAACGPVGGNFNWAEVIMKNIGTRMDGYGLHYYVFSNNWGDKGSATDFGEQDWFNLMKKTFRINELIEKNKEIMDEYDSGGRVALYVDEWGTWWDPEPGRNGAFLYQQNTIRDAVSAAIFLNAFNNHCDRVKMCNIAQTNNVLQAMILTDKEKMIVTQTYHVFDMYKVHQNATLLPSELICMGYRFEQDKVSALSASASRDASGKIHITLCNLDPGKAAAISCEIKGAKPKKVSGKILTAAAMNSHNTFDNPEVVKPVTFTDMRLKKNSISATLPGKSVVVLEIE